jgi:hypothetical protein
VESIRFWGANILVMMRYSGTLLSSIFAVYGAAQFYKYFRKSLPSANQELPHALL